MVIKLTDDIQLPAEIILEALRNTTTKEGAIRAIKQVEPLYEELENSFQGPAIYAELQRLHAVAEEETWTPQDEAAFRPLYKKWQRIQAKNRRNKTRKKKYGPRKRKNPKT
jgi:hypothetical protein